MASYTKLSIVGMGRRRLYACEYGTQEGTQTPIFHSYRRLFPVQTNNTLADACVCAFSLCKLTRNDIPNIPGN
jgi:hypothetical protein